MAKSQFVYKPRDTESVARRSTQSGSDYDTFFDPRFTKFTPDTGQNYIRILPPGWDNAEHFGFDYYLHSNVGPNNSQYLCLEKNAEVAALHGVQAGRCPVCEEKRVLDREGATEEAQQLKATHRIGVWLIDRNSEKDGPKFWDMSWTMDKDIAALQINKRTGEALLIDDPDEGYDFEFVREGKGINTRYIGKQISRQSSPISDDEKQQEAWLEFISNNPIPDVLNFYSYEYIAKVFAGGKTESEARTEPEPSKRTAAPETETPARTVPRRAVKAEETEETASQPWKEEEKPRLRARAKQAEPEDVEEDEENEDVESENKADGPTAPSSFRERMNKMNERNTRR